MFLKYLKMVLKYLKIFGNEIGFELDDEREQEGLFVEMG